MQRITVAGDRPHINAFTPKQTTKLMLQLILCSAAFRFVIAALLIAAMFLILSQL